MDGYVVVKIFIPFHESVVTLRIFHNTGNHSNCIENFSKDFIYASTNI